MPARPLLDQVLHLFGRDDRAARAGSRPGARFRKELPFVEDRRHGVAELMAATGTRGIADLIEQAKSRGELRADVPATALAHSLFALYFFQSAAMAWRRSDHQPAARRSDCGPRSNCSSTVCETSLRKSLAIKKSNPARRATSTVAARRNGRGGR